MKGPSAWGGDTGLCLSSSQESTGLSSQGRHGREWTVSLWLRTDGEFQLPAH